MSTTTNGGFNTHAHPCTQCKASVVRMVLSMRTLSLAYTICLHSFSNPSFPTDLLVFSIHSFLSSLHRVAISSTSFLWLCLHASVVLVHSVLSFFHNRRSFPPPFSTLLLALYSPPSPLSFDYVSMVPSFGSTPSCHSSTRNVQFLHSFLHSFLPCILHHHYFAFASMLPSISTTPSCHSSTRHCFFRLGEDGGGVELDAANSAV